MVDLKIEEILDNETIGVNLPGKNKEEAIHELAKLLLEKGYIKETDNFEKDIFYRETLGKTGIGNYIAIPHGQSESVLKNGIAIGKFSEEIEWETLDDKPVRIVCLFCVKKGDGGENEHLKMLAVLAGKLGKEEVVDDLLSAKDTAAMKEAFLMEREGWQ